MSHKSALLLLSDVASTASYAPLIERAAAELTEDGALDILLCHNITHLNTLDLVLAQVYTLATDILQEAGKSHIFVSVLFGEHYKEIPDPSWELLLLDRADGSYEQLELEDKDLLEVIEVPRATNSSQSIISRDPDVSHESIHNVSAVGGTFDHFHDGHKILLSAAAFLTKTTLIVGVTDEDLLKNKKYAEFLQSFDYRVHVVKRFLHHIKPSLKLDPQPIKDVCGPTAVIEDIDALIVSRETVKGAEFINNTRKEKGMKELQVHVINVIGGEADDGFKNKLSSTQLRKEEWEAAHTTTESE